MPQAVMTGRVNHFIMVLKFEVYEELVYGFGDIDDENGWWVE